MTVDSLGKVAPSAPPRRRRSSSNVAFLVHSATGLWLTILLSVVMVTGTITVLFAEIDWLIYSEMRVSPGEERVNPGVLYDSVRAAYPDAGINNVNTGAMHDRTAASAFLAIPGGGFRMVWVDQFTGEVIGDTGFPTVGTFINFMHTTLFLPSIGRYVVNFFGVMLLVSIVTGLITYKKFWRGFFRRPRFERDARTWLGDLHRLVALWSIWFLLIIGITGAWWFYMNPLVEPGGAPDIVEDWPEPPTLSSEMLDALGPETPVPLSGAEIATAVQTAYPDLTITGMNPPANASKPFTVRGDRGEVLVQGGANTVYVNPYTGEIMGARLSEDWSAMQRIDAAMHPLHYGSWAKRGGADLAVKLVWFLGGAVASFLAISGLIIYLKRTRKAAADALGGSRLAAGLRRVWNWIKPWGGPMGALKYVNILAVAGIVSGAILVLTLGAQGIGDKGKRFPAQAAGTFTITPVALAGFLEADLPPIRPGADTNIFPQIADGRFRDARFIRVGVADADGADADSELVEGAEGIAHAHLHLPETLDGSRLWIEIEGWDGVKHRAHWPLVDAQ
ncbi:MAG: PepSY-associated TM helix domain-containing protein [Pseudomonadota bacterium]